LRAKPAIFGALLAVGTFQSSALVVGVILIAWASYTAIKNRHIPLWAVVLWAAFGAPFRPMESTVTAGVILSLAVLADDVRRDWSLSSFVNGLLIGSVLQFTTGLYTWGESRPGLYSLNASVVAQTGLMFWFILPELKKPRRFYPWAWAAVHMAVSMSRFPLFAAGVMVALRPSRGLIVMYLGIVGVFLFAGYSQDNLSRLLPAQVFNAAGVRAELVKSAATDPDLVPVNVRVNPAPNPDAVGPSFTPKAVEVEVSTRHPYTGYGVGQYINKTGLVRPHNVAVLLFYEMGFLALIPILLFIWALLTRRIPFATGVAMLALWQIVEEPAALFEGFYTTAAVLIAVWRPSPVRRLTDVQRYALGKAPKPVTAPLWAKVKRRRRWRSLTR